MSTEVARISRAHRMLGLILLGPLMVAVGGYRLYHVIAVGETVYSAIGALVVILVGVLDPIVVLRYRLAIGEQFIEQRYWRTVKIHYSSIVRIEVGWRSVVIHSSEGKISTPGVLENRDAVFSKLGDRLLHFPGIRFSGIPERIRELFRRP
jgi:hypothetical protein